jgi:hypothetical protein
MGLGHLSFPTKIDHMIFFASVLDLPWWAWTLIIGCLIADRLIP